jgi:hypothetical protein
MRGTILAAIALCPMLIQAQVLSPAQPKSADTNPVLVSGLMKPKNSGTMFAAAAGDAVPDRTPEHVSTGVVKPKLIQTTQVQETANWRWFPTETEKLAFVTVIVDPTGKPSSVHMKQSLGPAIDKDVLASVSGFRFQPGTLNNASIPMEVELTLRIHNRNQ